jgi:hypothetical protein
MPRPDSFVSRLFGLSVRSSLPIPFAAPPDPTLPIDVTIHCGTLPAEPRPHVLDHVLSYDGVRFVVDAAGAEVWFAWEAPLDYEAACTYLVGGVFAFLARLRGQACIHASAVEVGGEALLFPGTASAGKSTLAAALVQRGFRLIAEDVLPLIERDGVLHAVPAYPGIRLWPQSVELLFGSADALPRITPSWEKRIFDARDRFASTPLRVGAIVFPEAAVGEEASRMYGVARSDSAVCLLGHSYHAEQCDAAALRREFELIGRLADEAPAHALVVGSGATELARACGLVLAEVGAVRHV